MMTFFLTLFLLVGIVFVALSIPIIQGRVGPNSWYGFRVRRTLEDPKVWYLVNTYVAWRGFWLGIALIVLATTLYFVPGLDFVTYAIIYGAATVAGLAILLTVSFRFLRSLDRSNG